MLPAFFCTIALFGIVIACLLAWQARSLTRLGMARAAVCGGMARAAVGMARAEVGNGSAAGGWSVHDKGSDKPLTQPVSAHSRPSPTKAA